MSELPTTGADWRDSLALLTNVGTLAFAFNDPGPRPRQLPQLVETSSEQNLRTAAAEGNPIAMERLGARLLYGEGLVASPQQGVEWLSRSAQAGNPVAMELLAEFWLAQDHARAREAEALLLAAVDAGYLPAQVTLGMHALEGAGLARDSARGERLLREAAWRGNRLAHLVLAACLIGGRGVAADREAGSGWLRRLGGVSALQVSALAAYALTKSLARPLPRRRPLAECSAVLFAEAVRLGHDADELNLAYLLRRDDVDAGDWPALDALLAKHVATGNSHALLNQALRLGRGVQCSVDWPAADALVARITDGATLASWWSERAQEGEAEGHLVLGWLARHGRASDPQGRSLQERLSLARAGGWDAPDWLGAAATG